MSELISINTEEQVSFSARIEPLSLYGENHPLLKEVMPEFDVSLLPNGDITLLAERLKLTMKTYSGVGLSANQCGVKRRVFVIGAGDFQMVCINPKIIRFVGEKDKKNEGCLSSPGLYLKIPRYESVEVEYYTETGELVNSVLNGVTAQCFQHELDHMNGIHFTELAGETSLIMARKKRDKLIKMIKRMK
jgi:peptide deformylase